MKKKTIKGKLLKYVITLKKDLIPVEIVFRPNVRLAKIPNSDKKKLTTMNVKKAIDIIANDADRRMKYYKIETFSEIAASVKELIVKSEFKRNRSDVKIVFKNKGKCPKCKKSAFYFFPYCICKKCGKFVYNGWNFKKN